MIFLLKNHKVTGEIYVTVLLTMICHTNQRDSCNECIQGNFVNWLVERGTIYKQSVNNESGDDSLTDESDYEDDNDNIDDKDDNEQYEIRGESVLEAIQKGSIIASYSEQKSMELFYLCKVVEFGYASENLCDHYNHNSTNGSIYIKCQYLQKIKEQKQTIYYRLLADEVLCTQVRLCLHLLIWELTLHYQ